MSQAHKKYDNYEVHTSQERCSKCGDSQHREGFRCQASKHQCRNCHISMGISVACATGRKNLNIKGLWSQDHPKHINFRLVQFAHARFHMWPVRREYPQVMILSACKLQLQVYTS